MLRVTRTRIMRAKTINPNPPICRSKEATLTYVDIYSCESGELLDHIERYGLTLPQARSIADGGEGTFSTGYFHEPSFKTFTDIGADHCPPKPDTIAEAYIYSCIDDTIIEHWEEEGLTLAEAQEKADGGPETYSTGYWRELPDGDPIDIGTNHCKSNVYLNGKYKISITGQEYYEVQAFANAPDGSYWQRSGNVIFFDPAGVSPFDPEHVIFEEYIGHIGETFNLYVTYIGPSGPRPMSLFHVTSSKQDPPFPEPTDEVVYMPPLT